MDGLKKRTVVPEGMLAHGRGEAFDYLLGEKTLPSARRATRVAAAHLLLAQNPVISVNGNVVALVADGIAELASAIPAKVEVNLFHRTRERQRRIALLLKKKGIKEVLGTKSEYERIPNIASSRAKVDSLGISMADVVLVPLEDGDRAGALRHLGKTVVAIDLNPMSRTSRLASVTIVDNIVRAIPILVDEVRTLRKESKAKLGRIVSNYGNEANLSRALSEITHYLSRWNRS